MRRIEAAEAECRRRRAAEREAAGQPRAAADSDTLFEQVMEAFG